MLLTTFFAVAKNMKELDSKRTVEEVKTLSFDEVDVPVWEIDDSWTYNIADMVFVIHNENLSENLTIELDAQIGNFTLKVVDDSGDTYQVRILETTITGGYLLETDLGDGPIKISGILHDTSISGNLYFNKEDLGISQFDGAISGKLTVSVEEQPYFDKSIFPKIPISAAVTIEMGLENPLPIIQFPLNSSFSVWGTPATNASIGGTIGSIWLNISNFINEKIRQWELIRLVSRILPIDEQALQNISDIIDDILPIIDIEYVLNEYLGVDNVFSTPEIPYIFFCNNTVEITVPAGPFECFEIIVAGGLGTIYYSPDVKNIIKMEGDFDDVLPFLCDIDAELIDYS